MSNYTGGVKNRRNRVIARLEAQLKSGKKPAIANIPVDLTDKDKARITKEIETLKSRV